MRTARAPEAKLATILQLPVAYRRLRTNTPMAAREARRYSVEVASRFRPQAAMEDLALLVGDLVNAATLASHRSVELRVRSMEGGLRVEMTGDPTTLDRHWPSGDVALVGAVAERWGITEPPDEPVTIWFELVDDPNPTD